MSSTQKQKNTSRVQRIKQWSRRLFDAVVYGGTLFYLGVMMLLITESLLAPWGSIEPILDTVPPPETWQYALNRFFDVGIGQYIGTAMVGGISLWMLWRVWQHKAGSLWQLALCNGLMLVALLGTPEIGRSMNALFFTVPGDLPPERYSEAIGYHLSVIPLLLDALVIIVWTRLQLSLTRDRRKSKVVAAVEKSQVDAARFRQVNYNRLTRGETGDSYDHRRTRHTPEVTHQNYQQARAVD